MSRKWNVNWVYILVYKRILNLLNGLIEQCGNTSEYAESAKIVMFPIKFTNIPFVIININENITQADNYNFGFNITQESFKFKRDSNLTKVWFAFGY